MKKRKPTLRKKKQQSAAGPPLEKARRAPSTFEVINKDLVVAGWGKDELTQELEQAFYNIRVSFLNLRPYFELLQKANEIFMDAFEQMATNTLEGDIAHVLFGRSCGCFLGAVRLSCSGQLAETWVLLRACIENSLYAFYISRNPKHAKIWIDRHKDEASKKKCKDTFKVGSIWAELKTSSATTAKEAKQLYDRAIDWGAHPNERSVFPNIVPKQDGSGLSLHLITSDPTFIRVGVIYTIKTSLLTFRIFALVFPDVFGQPNLQVKMTNLSQQSRPLMAILAIHLKELASNKR